MEIILGLCRVLDRVEIEPLLKYSSVAYSLDSKNVMGGRRLSSEGPLLLSRLRRNYVVTQRRNGNALNVMSQKSSPKCKRDVRLYLPRTRKAFLVERVILVT